MTEQPQPTKRERREAARAERVAAEQQADAAHARKRRLGIFGGVLVVAVALVAIAVAISSNSKSDPQKVSSSEVAAINALYAGIPQQGLTLGDPQAKATIVLFADPQCPFCRQFEQTELPDVIKNQVRTGDAKLVLRMRAFLGPDSIKGAKVLYSTAEQNKLFETTGTLYAQQGEENSGWLTDAKVREILSAVPGLDASKALIAASGPDPARRLTEAQKLANQYQPDQMKQQTPDVYIGTTVNNAEKTDPTAAAIAKAVNEIVN